MSIVTISPSGGDDTGALQSAINSTASAGNTLQLQTGNFTTGPLTIPGNATIQLVGGVTVTASSSGFGANIRMLNVTGSNVSITGASAATSIFHMLGPGAYSGAQNHCMDIDGGSSILNNITLSACSFNDSGGDGIYLRAASNVTINNCTCNNNTRQGLSITGLVNHVRVNGCTFSNSNAAPPAAGIDIEPNAPNEYLQDIVIADCASTSNHGDGILLSLQNINGTTPAIAITVLRHTATGNGTAGVTGGTDWGFSGYRALNADPGGTNAPGFILFQDCSSINSAYWGAFAGHGGFGANGAPLIFKNLTVTNANQSGPDQAYSNSAAVAVARGGGGGGLTGNVHFINCNVSCNGTTQYYFDFWDSSATGPVNVQFVPGTLSGATTSTSSLPGRWNGANSGAIH